MGLEIFSPDAVGWPPLRTRSEPEKMENSLCFTDFGYAILSESMGSFFDTFGYSLVTFAKLYPSPK